MPKLRHAVAAGLCLPAGLADAQVSDGTGPEPIVYEQIRPEPAWPARPGTGGFPVITFTNPDDVYSESRWDAFNPDQPKGCTVGGQPGDTHCAGNVACARAGHRVDDWDVRSHGPTGDGYAARVVHSGGTSLKNFSTAAQVVGIGARDLDFEIAETAGYVPLWEVTVTVDLRAILRVVEGNNGTNAKGKALFNGDIRVFAGWAGLQQIAGNPSFGDYDSGWVDNVTHQIDRTRTVTYQGRGSGTLRIDPGYNLRVDSACPTRDCIRIDGEWQTGDGDDAGILFGYCDTARWGFCGTQSECAGEQAGLYPPGFNPANDRAIIDVEFRFLGWDCNGNYIPDAQDIASGVIADWDNNGRDDVCDIAAGLYTDCDADSIPDEREVIETPEVDWNTNGIHDACDIAAGLLADCDGDFVPDIRVLDTGLDDDWNGNGIPDQCDIDSGMLTDCDGDRYPDERLATEQPTLDCNGDLVLDACQVVPDEDGDGNGDWCQIVADPSLDCNGNFRLDAQDLLAFTEWDCNQNGLPDSCERTLIPVLDLDGDGVLDDCVPSYRVRDLDALLGIGSSYYVTDISDSGILLAARSNSATVYAIDLSSGVREDFQFASSLAARRACVNRHGEIASAVHVGNETVVWRAQFGEPGVAEIARVEHNADRTLYNTDVFGLSDIGVLLVESNAFRAFVGDAWQHRIHAIDIRNGSVSSTGEVYQYPEAIFPDGRLVLRKYNPYTPGRVRTTTTSFSILEEYFPPSWNTQNQARFWQIDRSGAARSGAIAMIQRRTTSQSTYSPVLVLPSRAEVPRRIEYVAIAGEDNFDRGAWVTDSFTMVAYDYFTVPRAWPTPERPGISYLVNELIAENPDGVPTDSGNTDGFAEEAGISGRGVFADDLNGLLYESLPTSPPGLDLNADGLVDDADLLALVTFLEGGDTTSFDINRDGAVNEADAQALAWWLIASRADTLPDCDGNGVPDLAQLARFGGTLADDNNDLVPDGCGQAGCNAADVALPVGTLDIDDVLLYLSAFNAGDPLADIAPPAGTLDIDDILTFLLAFDSGCP